MSGIVAKISSFFTRHIYEVVAFSGTFIILSSVFFFSALRFSTDDQFILFRYIENLASGNGFVFNLGDKILGATTPLFTLVGAFFKYLFASVPTPDIMAWLNIVFFSLATVFFYRLAKRFMSSKMSLVAVLVLATSLSKVVPEGMETSLFLLTLFVFLEALFNKKYYLSAVFLSLTLLTRPDALLVAPLAFIYWWRELGIKEAFKVAGLTGLVAVPWLVFSTLYFGSFIPQSLITKLHIGDIVQLSSLQAFKVQLASMSRMYWGKIFDPSNLILQSVCNLIPFLVLMYLGARKVINARTWIIFAIPVAYFISFTISNPVMWPWYVSQMEPFWILISFIGFVSILESIKNNIRKVVLVCIILAGPLYFWMGSVATDDAGRELMYVPIAHYIREHMTPGETVGVNNIGAIGYYLGTVHVIDFFGLVNAYAVEYYPITENCTDPNRLYSVPPQIIKDTSPDWVVLTDTEELKNCFEDWDWFTSRYVVIEAPQIPEGSLWKRIR